MAKKNCMVFETLGKVSDLQIQESQNKAEGMRLSGVFGVCGVKNCNNRIYDKNNYSQMVESLQKTIATEGCPGELEHPNSMNINLENVSHKIESIQMNEDGTITGTILLLNTPKGKIAQAIVEGGLPLYISSRGAGSITNEGRVTLSTIKTYDLVGTPGFSQAKLNLKENQTVESLNESLDEGNISWAIVEAEEEEKEEVITEGDDLLSGGDDDKKDDSDKDSDDKDDTSDSSESSDDDEDSSSDDESSSDDSSDDEEKQDDKENTDNNVNMNDLKEAIDKLSDKVTSLEAQLHIAKESLESPINYDAIEQWIKEEFAPEFKSEITESIANGVQQWVVEEFAPEVQNWVCEEFAPEVQNWVVEEFAPEVQNWICEEFQPEVENEISENVQSDIKNWVCEDYSAKLQQWMLEEYSPEVQGWITEEFAPVLEGWITDEFSPVLESKVNENVNGYLNETKATRLSEIDSLLETLSNDDNADVKRIVAEQKDADKYANLYVVENMPAEYQPSWQMLNEERKDEIVRSSRMYDFTKEGVLENFWARVDFNKANEKPVYESKEITSDYHNNVFAQMMRLRKH